jgi:hypothetical protein
MSRLIIGQITIKKERAISSTEWYYLLQPANANPPDSSNYGNPPPIITDTGYSGWSVTEPTYTIGDERVLYQMVQTIFSDGDFSYTTPTISSSYEAAKAAYNEALQAEADIEDLQELGLHHGYIWYNSTARPATGSIPVYPVGSYIASGINNTINQTNSNTYGLNTWISTGGINLRYNAIDLAKLTTSTLEFYYPSTSNQGTAAISLGTHSGINSLIFYGFGSTDKQMELTSTALKFYGSSQSTPDVTLNSTGLNIEKGSITLGSDFSVTSDGTLTASNASIGGTITAGANSKIGPWNITDTSIWYGNSTYGNASGIYFGTSGISLGSTFKVSSAGALTATSGSIAGFNFNTTQLVAYGTASGAGTSSTGLYNVLLNSSPGTNGNSVAIGVATRSSTGSSWTWQAYVKHDGTFKAQNADITGSIVATSFTAKANNVDRAIVDSNGLTIKDGSGNLKAVFGSSINIYGGNSSSGALPKVYIGSANIQIQGTDTNSKHNYIQVNSTGLEVFKEESSVALFGATTRIGPVAEDKNNIVIEDDTIKFRKNATNLASFYTISNSFVDDGLTIRTNGDFNVYVANRNPSATYPDFSISNRTSENRGFLVQFGGYFTSNPMIIADSTSSNITLSAGTPTTIPLNHTRTEIHGADLFEIQSNRVYMRVLDGNFVRVTASAYVTPSSNALVNLFIYYYSADNNTTDEVAASATYLTTNGGAVQITPRVFKDAVSSGDYFYLQARIVGSGGTVVCNHRDTQLTVELM